MASMKIKKGDMVKVIAGRDKDKEGKVIAVNKKDNTLLVEGVNMVTKHAKPSMANQQGGILHQEGPIDASNVMFLQRKSYPCRFQDGRRQESTLCEINRRCYRLIEERRTKH